MERLWSDARSNIATLADPEQSWQRKVFLALVAIFLVQTIGTSIYRRMIFKCI
jgi:hypothetical protein